METPLNYETQHGIPLQTTTTQRQITTLICINLDDTQSPINKDI